MQDSETDLLVQDLGEQGLLQRLQNFCPAELIGDDAAVLALPPGRSLVVTADMLVDGVHFSDRTTAPEDAGWRAAAANLSDLAAMGAEPTGITVSLGLPGNLPVIWVERLYQGLTACLQPYQVPIVGGDTCRSPVVTVAITAFGTVAEPVIRRNQARPGDAILATGWHGASRAGLELLWHPESGQDLSPDERTHLILTHQRPRPRLDVLPLLRTIAPFPTRIAGMDSSDGLADAVLQICRASGVGARLTRQQLPVAPGLTAWVGADQALNWALYGGEDFELVLCLLPELAEALLSQLGQGAAIVGQISETPEVWLEDRTGQAQPMRLNLEQGFQHFA